jgi:hypothetical protein
LVLGFVEGSAIDVLVVFCMCIRVPLLLNMLEVTTELRPPGVTLLECEVLPKLLIEKLVDGSIGIDTSSRIAVPILVLCQSSSD